MPTPKWLTVAQNEYRLHTSGIRTIRPYFPIITIGLLAVYVAVIAPTLVTLFLNDVLAFFLSQVAVAMVEVILFLLFTYIVIVPITDTLRDVQTGKVEAFLAAPVTPSSVLLGEYLGDLPFYAIAFTVIAGIFTAILTPLGLGWVQMTLVVMVFVVSFLSALWIGTVIAAILRTRLGHVARGKDVGRALSVIIVLPLIALMYALIGGGLLDVLADPGTGGIVRAVLGVLPSSWGAELIVGFARHPGNISAIGIETLTRFGGLLAFFGASLWLGTKAANRAYTLESTTFTAATAKPDGAFYHAITFLGGGGSFSRLLVAIFKDYSRRLENLSWLAYVVGLIALVSIFFGGPSADPVDPLMLMSILLIPMLAGFTVGNVSRGKATLHLHRKAPSGIRRFVKARLLQGGLVAVPIAVAVIVVATLLVPQMSWLDLATNTTWVALRTVANVVFLLGLALLIPNFAEEARARTFSIMVNLQIAVFTTIGMDIGFSKLDLSLSKLLPNIDRTVVLYGDHLIQSIIMAVVGIVLLTLGRRKVTRIE